MAFLWNKQPTGPLFVRLSLQDDGVKLKLYVKHRDACYNHNCFLDLEKGSIAEKITLLDDCKCPECKEPFWFSSEDKYNLLYCKKCKYEAWSDKIYFYSLADIYDYE